ncbi:MAG TPA: hypothetical protein VM533_02335 [Fimbriiglobus sp.]|nr:hypothetical protein [Fimbriiglobus sp.]
MLGGRNLPAARLDLFADCTNQRLVPNPDHPDQPVSKFRRRR